LCVTLVVARACVTCACVIVCVLCVFHWSSTFLACVPPGCACVCVFEPMSTPFVSFCPTVDVYFALSRAVSRTRVCLEPSRVLEHPHNSSPLFPQQSFSRCTLPDCVLHGSTLQSDGPFARLRFTMIGRIMCAYTMIVRCPNTISRGCMVGDSTYSVGLGWIVCVFLLTRCRHYDILYV